ncbi:acyl-CoA dehydrogenase [Oceanobacillus piezotolerans]|uniref:Dibenzothiophene monooxygenase n=1 Tax=Oceanobacillus piezotolerans TaxID=2448030 RepID=A0A498DKN6_9BACI|nr:acyl-CoA dehydrogenase family protein [Oceanobacillus piezotolerans]RLL47052.1 acyl-CoA dehydrogenase [Oceanobacillus piezotolerans]
MVKILSEPIDIHSESFETLLSTIKEDAQARRAQPERLLPLKAIQLIKEAKLGAIRLPKELGGADVTTVELLDVVRRLASVDPDVAHALRAHFIFTEDNLAAPTSEERTRRLQFIAKGELVGNATTEISSKPQGSKQYETLLSEKNEDYELNGKKYFTTGTLYADWVYVVSAGENDKVFVSVIPTNREGVDVYDDWDGFGQQLTASGTATFTNVLVKRHETIELKREQQNYVPIRQIFLQAVISGIVEAIVEDSVHLVKNRKRTFTHGAAEIAQDDPLLLQTIGEIQATAFTLKSLIREAARAIDLTLENPSIETKHEAALQVAYVKVIGEQLALQASTKLFDVGGASATRQGLYLDRHWRNIRTIASHNPSSYKLKDIGNYLVNNENLPINGYY